MSYCIRVHHNGVVYETFAIDYNAAIVVFEALFRDYGAGVSLWKGAEKLR